MVKAWAWDLLQLGANQNWLSEVKRGALDSSGLSWKYNWSVSYVFFFGGGRGTGGMLVLVGGM